MSPIAERQPRKATNLDRKVAMHAAYFIFTQQWLAKLLKKNKTKSKKLLIKTERRRAKVNRQTAIERRYKNLAQRKTHLHDDSSELLVTIKFRRLISLIGSV